jgi:trehalose 6-phosphate phosphatase
VNLLEVARSRIAQGPSLIALDFDGTLTEIATDFRDPGLDERRRGVLARIPGAGRRLAIVSGRALPDLRARVGLREAIYVGNHGLEIDGAGLRSRFAPAGSEDRLAALLDSLPLPSGILVENKSLTATLHVRPLDDRSLHGALRASLEEAVSRAGFELRPGKSSWEIRPAGAKTKGDAVAFLIGALPGVTRERTVYIGDDATDEDAFRALSPGLPGAGRGKGGITVRVGEAGIATAARHRLPDPDAVYRFLESLVDDRASRRARRLP